MKNKFKKLLSLVIVLCMMIRISPYMQTQAAVKLSDSKKILEVGQTTTLKVKGTSKKVKWSSDDNSVASVNRSGKVTAKEAGSATIKAKVANKTLKCKVTVKYPEIRVSKTVVYKDRNVSISYTGLSGYILGYEIDLEVENLSNRSLTIYNAETSINGYMSDASCYIEIAPGKKIRDSISVTGSDAEEIPIRKVESVETKFKISDDEDMQFEYETKTIQIIGRDQFSNIVDYSNETIGFEKEEARKCLSISSYPVLNGAIATVKSTYGENVELDITFAMYDSSGKLIDSQVADSVQVAKGVTTNAHVESESKNIAFVKSVISDVRKGNQKNHPEKISFINKNGSKNGVSAQVNNLGDEDFESVRLSCVFIKSGKPVGYSVEYIEHIPKNSHSYVTFDIPQYEKHVRDSDGDWHWDYVNVDCDQYAILIDYAYYE